MNDPFNPLKIEEYKRPILAIGKKTTKGKNGNIGFLVLEAEKDECGRTLG